MWIGSCCLRTSRQLILELCTKLRFFEVVRQCFPHNLMTVLSLLLVKSDLNWQIYVGGQCNLKFWQIFLDDFWACCKDNICTLLQLIFAQEIMKNILSLWPVKGRVDFHLWVVKKSFTNQLKWVFLLVATAVDILHTSHESCQLVFYIQIVIPPHDHKHPLIHFGAYG